MTSIQKLLSISSATLSQHCEGINFGQLGDYGPLGQQLDTLLHQCNGFYAFESALHVFPAAAHLENTKEIPLNRWNSFELWRFEYGDLADRMLFFAEDAF